MDLTYGEARPNITQIQDSFMTKISGSRIHRILRYTLRSKLSIKLQAMLFQSVNHAISSGSAYLAIFVEDYRVQLLLIFKACDNILSLAVVLTNKGRLQILDSLSILATTLCTSETVASFYLTKQA